MLRYLNYRPIRGAVSWLMPLAILLSARPATAGIHQVWDEAHLFKAQTIEQVDEILNDIHEKYHKDLMVETFPSVPDDFKARMQQAGIDNFFEGWARGEGSELRLNGIIILICGNPRHFLIEPGLATRQKAFTEADRDELATKMAPILHKNDFDGALLLAAQFVRDRLEKNLGEPTTRPTTQPIEKAQFE